MEKSKGLTYFYQNDTLSAVSEGRGSVCFFRAQRTAFAETHREKGSANLLACDAHGSILNVATTRDVKRISYTPYGHLPADGRHSYLGFNGEHVDVSDVYLLGNGYRTYNPALMRFHSADNLSPFGEGGLNAYAYCQGDPVNHIDPSGHRVEIPSLVLQEIFARSRAQVRHRKPMQTPGPLTQKYIRDLTLEVNTIDLGLAKVNERLTKVNQSLLNFQVNKPGVLKELQDLKWTARQANARTESNHWDVNTRFRYVAEASWDGGRIKHHLNTHAGLAKADKYYNEMLKLETVQRELLSYRQEVIDAVREVGDLMSNLRKVRR